ncbi:FHA domain-containing protein [Amycolatopsis acidicola]|uniref:FHA domain-containing protein n=1 Tax=Amycolatopsis acidicola TaxID=2596893 RepID=A0A5N0UJY3_9PSEU|nr:FHA domain-containing protein [Amycolatopsis acidicola]KAA9149622.1 FHA domain-containing protein [Amycolatopsis acidicola]
MPVCAQGHDSADDEFCDVCGLAFDGPAAAEAVAAQPEPEPEPKPCPVCGATLEARFCENCGADSLAVQTTEAPAAAEPVRAVQSWSVVVSADRAYFEKVKAEGGPDAEPIEFPPFCPERHFPLSGGQVTIGRRSQSRGILPDIDLTGPPEDIGVSRLHALLVAGPAGWSVVDMGSANGTYLNRAHTPLPANVPHPLEADDEIHLGAWTTLTIHPDA